MVRSVVCSLLMPLSGDFVYCPRGLSCSIKCPFKFYNQRELVALLLVVFLMPCGVSVLCLFLVSPWVGMMCVIVAFSDHTHSSVMMLFR